MSARILKPPVDPARDHIRGPTDARVTLLEYGDYECPHCGDAHRIVEPLRQEFGDRVRLVWRHFPRPEHRHAHLAAEAAEAAGVQGRYWDLHDLLLTHQDALEAADLERYAAELGLDQDRFRSDLRAHAFHARVGQDLASAVHSGAHGTPTFFINGVLHLGPDDYQDLRTAVAEQLGPASLAGAGDDAVGEASRESFPASDPPSWAGHVHPTPDEAARR